MNAALGSPYSGLPLARHHTLVATRFDSPAATAESARGIPLARKPTILPVPIAKAALVPASLNYAPPHALTADYDWAPSEPAMPYSTPVHQLPRCNR
jgi:hypothetical protein